MVDLRLKDPRQAGAPVSRSDLNPQQKNHCRSQGGFASNCTINATWMRGRQAWPFHIKIISGFRILPSGQDANGGVRPCDRGIPAHLKACSLLFVPPQPQIEP
ncbi:hypothetical protein PoB_006015600 [Plakobranchus ocellatus]|uniref:Uncharacterized protein n=1 Tax=Plakobranchus ocellatus TaxID=259542 RepID=A0AAV4CP36_9GAST|nr:hypothetical protein PoB_006015600 [Plakobranchus ocellatus]